MARGRAVNGAGSIRKRSDGTWECRYTNGYDSNGKLIRKSVYGKTADEVAKKLREITSQIDSNTFIQPQKMSLSEWAEIWLSEYCLNVKPGTLKEYTDVCRTHIIPALGKIKLCNLSAHDVQRFINRLGRTESAKTHRPLSAKTIKNIHGTLSKCLSECVRIKYITDNPANGCILPKVTRGKIHALEPDEIQLFLNEIESDRYSHIFYIAINTGMRISEICGLRWSRVDLETGKVKVDCQMLVDRGTGTKRELGATKNGKTRSFILPPSVTDRLKQVKRDQTLSKLQAGALWDNKLDLVFTNETGGEVQQRTLEKHFKRIMQAIGCGDKGYVFHDLRHTFTVECIRAGVDVKSLSSMLGHSSVAFTLDVYGEFTAAMQEETANRIEAAILRRKIVG